VAGALANGRYDGARGAVAPATDVAGAQRRGDRGSRALGASRASCLGWAEDRQAAEGSGAGSSSGALDDHGDPEAAWGGTEYVRRRSVRLRPLRAGTDERAVADGLQGPRGHAHRPASS